MAHTDTSQGGLFTQLEPLLVHRAVLVTVSKIEGDRLQVNICPRQLKEGEKSGAHDSAVCDRHRRRARCRPRASDFTFRGLSYRSEQQLDRYRQGDRGGGEDRTRGGEEETQGRQWR